MGAVGWNMASRIREVRQEHLLERWEEASDLGGFGGVWVEFEVALEVLFGVGVAAQF